MMTLFKQRASHIIERMTKLHDSEEYINLSIRDKTKFNRKILRDSREGDYLIKVSRNNKRNYVGEDAMYVDYTYLVSGWFALGPRKDAQYFTGKEAFEWVSNTKGFTIVKRSN